MFELVKVVIIALAGGGWAFIVLAVYGAFKISSRCAREEEQRDARFFTEEGGLDVHQS